jgi:diaminopimelate epimerase
VNTLPFVKMQAQGNDFVILDGLHEVIPELEKQAILNITERRYGIGCDQLLLLRPDDVADVRMLIFNSDGSEAKNCGNGLRCVADLLLRRMERETVRIALADRHVMAERSAHGVRVQMGAAVVTDVQQQHSDVNVGNEHRVVFELADEAAFPADKNIEIVTGQIANRVYIDIIERGVGPTRACGSGATATAVAVWQREGHREPLTIAMPGGEVVVSASGDDVWLEGRVAEVFRGVYSGKGDQCSTS